MTVQKGTKAALSSDKLLTAQEQALCKQFSRRKAPHSQRASMLLALNQGSTQAQAANKAGMTIGQVKYWAARFRKQRTAIFPDVLKEKSQGKAVAPAKKAGKAAAAEVSEKQGGKAGKKSKKADKGKKGKGKKKKKGKKAGKGKK